MKCLICNKEFYIRKSIEKVRKTCSKDCCAKYLSIIHKGKRLWKHKDIKPLAKFECLYCHTIKEIKANRINYGEGKFCSRDCSNKYNKKFGEDNNKWKNGITPYKVSLRKSNRMKEWRKEVFERDNFTCQICKKVGGDLEAHHCTPVHKLIKTKLEEFIFDIKNGITLCKLCHSANDNYRKL